MDHWDALEIAIWFHDAIYNPEAQMVTPGYSENESIELMYSLFSSWTFRDPYESSLQRQIAIAAALIRATASHGSASVDKLTDLMLDIDLSSLALPTKQFNVNTENVIAEYALFRDPVTIILGNARFLKGLYASPRLFHTEWGFSNFESASRYNILNRVNDVLPYAEWI
jgi:predicted metal-dependent HD superfamily phosphohydrolase